MTLAEFFTRFRDDQEIGNNLTDKTLEFYYDNGQDVGRVVQNRRTTISQPELLDPEHAAAARDWCARHRRERESHPACLAEASGRRQATGRMP